MKARVHLRSSRGPIAVIIIHSVHCAACHAYVQELARHESEMAEWDGHLIVALRQKSETLHLPDTSDLFQTIDDFEERLPWRAPAVIVADEWGEVFFDAEVDHGFVRPREILEWLRFVAIQCPECEQPEGAWQEL